ncbi:class I adenylate-forming enzyme family protein [Halobellus captivus]|uniref:class I adenylate-forming enzyme family protein n=1 Tax=Halobellus captivus TaxID=2592614 RepID=UPI0011A2CAB4|nr:class I adenylate-forming enzyme family protein [Halobellus captivus]
MQVSPRVELPAVRELSSIAAETNPDRVAFGNGISGREITWAEFDAESKRAANALREHVRQGDRIAYLTEASVEQTILWNAGLKAGCIVSNLHVRGSPESVRTCIDSLRPRVLVVDEERSEFVEEHVYDSVSTDIAAVVTTGESQTEYERPLSSFTTDQPADEPDVTSDPDDVAAVMWTSGTTGKPKGWCHTNRSLVLRAMKLAHKKGTTRLTRVSNFFTPSFAAWYSTTLPTMLANGSSYYVKQWSPEAYVELVEERSITSSNLVPTMWREVLRVPDLEEYDLSSLVTVESGGETLTTTTLEQLQERISPSVSQSYSATEVCGTYIDAEEMQGDRIDSVGKPHLGVQVRVIESGGSPDDVVDPGEVGEIIVKSAESAVWVWEDTEKTRESFEDGWWYSGDLGYQDEEGYLFIEGRDDNMILSKGIKVFPTPVEERLNAHPDVVEAAVFGVEDEEYGERVTAAVHATDADLTAEDLDEWCLQSDSLSRYERPRAYHFYESTLPRTASDKLDRTAIKERSVGESEQ